MGKARWGRGTLWGAVLLAMNVCPLSYGEGAPQEPAGDEGVGWYWGLGMHGLHSDGEHDGDIVTDLDFLGPRLYAGRRLNEYLGIEAEIGRAVFQGNLWQGVLDGDLRMWNTAVTAMAHIPWRGSPIEPLVYAGVGRSFWEYDVSGRSAQGSYETSDSSSDFYWHVGAGVQIPITSRIIGRVGYRYWRSNMSPRPDRWAANPNDYYYKRQGLEVGMHWRF